MGEIKGRLRNPSFNVIPQQTIPPKQRHVRQNLTQALANPSPGCHATRAKKKWVAQRCLSKKNGRY